MIFENNLPDLDLKQFIDYVSKNTDDKESVAELYGKFKQQRGENIESRLSDLTRADQLRDPSMQGQYP